MASTSPPIAPRVFSVHRRWSSESESVEHRDIQATGYLFSEDIYTQALKN